MRPSDSPPRRYSRKFNAKWISLNAIIYPFRPEKDRNISAAQSCLLLIAMAVAILWLCCCEFVTASGLRIVDEGEALACIVTPAKPSAKESSAASLLSEYIAQSTGARLGIYTESAQLPTNINNRIHIGKTELAESVVDNLGDLDADGYVLQPVDNDTLIIIGATDWGTEYGVYEFLERFVGVRWLMPGEFGTHVPTKTEITGPIGLVVDEPASFSRYLGNGKNDAQREWLQRNRLRNRIQFHHNLLKLFPPESYTKTHPEFFPMRNGDRFLPSSNSQHGWQPCFSAPGIVDEAIRNISRFFTENPEANSYSLGINDSGGHCQCAECQNGGNVSDTYYQWCNSVVDGVSKEHPDKYFGLLAYRDVIEPPKQLVLNQRIVPFICYDRMKWALPAEFEKGRALTNAWHNASPVIAWYDYMYGTPYLIPRVYFQQMAKNYRFAYEHGVRAHYAETAPNWGEGPKLWISSKLQWDPYLSIDQLLDEWYVACVGKDAAPTLAEYYKIWEDFWTGSPLTHGTWFSKSTAEYLNFATPDYLDQVTVEMIQRSRELLEATVSKATTREQKERANLLLRAFEYYEASTYTYLASLKHFDGISSENEAIEFIAATLSSGPIAEKRESLLADFENHPILMHPASIYNQYHSGLRSESWGVGSLWPVYPWVEKSQKVRRRLEELSQSGWTVYTYQAKYMLEQWNDQNQR